MRSQGSGVATFLHRRRRPRPGLHDPSL